MRFGTDDIAENPEIKQKIIKIAELCRDLIETAARKDDVSLQTAEFVVGGTFNNIQRMHPNYKKDELDALVKVLNANIKLINDKFK